MSAAVLGSNNLGERVSILYSIPDDPEHPFSEVTGVLQRVTDAGGPDARYSIVRRSGEIVEVRRDAVLKLKLLPAGTGPLRIPPSWETDEG
ncbi:MAG TPA: hypothetical protein VM754_04400 [Actinomycetota bacterium]|nr:hypothetical protein [Actinomycetota bacterium]